MPRKKELSGSPNLGSDVKISQEPKQNIVKQRAEISERLTNY